VTTVCVILPTYNEAGSIGEVLIRLRTAVPAATLVVVDDGSPDGTADIAEGLNATLGNISVMRRSQKLGLGAAYRAGLGWAIDAGYDIAVAMDSDLSHDPAVVPTLVSTLDDEVVQLAIGSRYVPGGGTVNWPWSRRLLSRGGNLYAALVLGLGTKDATAGFRAYRVRGLQAIGITRLRSDGYAFQLEAVHQLNQRYGRAAIRECPITFRDRVAGESKMSWHIAAEAMGRVARWGITMRTARIAVVRTNARALRREPLVLERVRVRRRELVASARVDEGRFQAG
jgi:dolichol-phosphate mannosyltransferase